MKPSFKILTTISAIGFSLYFLWRLIIHFRLFGVETLLQTLTANPLWRELYYNLFVWLISGCIILLLVAFLVKGDDVASVSKPFKKYTFALAALCTFTLIVAVWRSTGMIAVDFRTLWPPFWLDMLLLVAVIAWLVILPRQASLGRLSRPLKIAMVCGIVLLSIPLVLQLVSGYAFFHEGYIYGLRSTLLYSWLRFFVPTPLICWYCIELQKQ